MSNVELDPVPDFTSAFWSASLPPTWHGQHHPECATFASERNVGALQISSARKDGDVTDDDLRDFAASHLSNGAKAHPVGLGEFAGFTFSYSEGESYWRQWFLRSGSLAVFVTYNCAIERMHQEDAVVEGIVGSLRPRL